jgi:hypothetical protein
MRFLLPALTILWPLLLAGPLAHGETLADLLDDPATQLSRPADRTRVVTRMAQMEGARRQNARTRAALLGLPLRTTLPNGRVQEISSFDGDRPRYFITGNVNAAISTGANLLRATPYSLSGAGVTIGLWDGGSARSTHQEFGGRVTVMDGAAAIDHATHVGGTLIASGVVAAAHGMADSATINSYDWNSDITEMTSRGATYAGEPGKIYLSNHSYGIVSGWNYVNATPVGKPFRVWEWYGSGASATSIETDFGLYNTSARDDDALAFNAPYYLIFRSAGNDRGDNPTTGQAVALAPGGTTVVTYNPAIHPGGDGTYRSGFDTIGFDAVAKNVMTVGSASDAVTTGLRDITKASVSYFSCWGPTDDGRIKPDVVANGENLYSSLGNSDTSYGTYSGTSMATPNAVGSSSLLIQQYGNLFPGQAMRASTLKGLLIHTANDLGNPGPDYKYGWGLLNVKTAADLIVDHQASPAKQRITENQITTTTITRTHSFIWDGVSPISATLCWTDPAAAALTTSDSRSARLVNDLNLKIIAPNGTVFYPFVMPFVGTWTEASMGLAATTGINTTDNVEQVRITAPPVAGAYQAVISFAGTLYNNSSQNYSLLLTGSSAQPLPLALTAISPTSGLAGATVTLDLTGTGMRADTTVKLTRSGQSDIAATAVQLIGSSLRCQVILTGAAAGTWNVVATNPNSETATLAAAFTVIGAIWSENFDGLPTGWSSLASTGSNSWNRVTTKSQSASYSYFASGPSTKSTTILTSPSIPIPLGATNLQLKFWHLYNLQSRKDGGRLELSTDAGNTWFGVDASGSGAAFASNGYVNTITSSSNELYGKSAWTGSVSNFVETIVNLTDTAKFAGKNLRLRWILATNSGTSSVGWYVDSVVLLGGVAQTNQAPTITSAATSTSTETVTDPDTSIYQIVRNASIDLAVAANDDAGEAALTYTWSLTGGTGGAVTFAPNATNPAMNTTANFEAAGDYQLSVSVSDAQGLAVSSGVNVRVLQTAAGLIINPALATLPVNATQAFNASLLDQFSLPMANQPATFDWSASGGGSINSAGLYTATTAGGPYVVAASYGGFSNIANVTVNQAAATISLVNLVQTYNGSPRPVTATTTPAGLPLAITYNGSSTVPSAAGSYAITATVTDPNYTGSATATLVIDKATATVSLSNLTQTYNGSQCSVTVTTTPAGLPHAITYNGSPTVPSAAGSYDVIATITDANHTGSAAATLVIDKATATVSLANLTQTYDGSPRPVTVTTTPALLAVAVTYDASATVPSAAGSYAVIATITDANHTGSATATLVIDKTPAAVDLTNLSQTYNGSPRPVTATTTPAQLAVAVTYNASATVPSAAGTYDVIATITDANHTGSATAMLVIDKAPAAVDLTNMAQTYTGSPCPVTVTTTPAQLAVAVTYNGSATIPNAAGTYDVIATITDANHTGSTSATLVIDKAPATVNLTNLSQTYTGSPCPVTVITTPAQLAVAVTYNGSATIPNAVGSYDVIATITDANHTGSASATLVIDKAPATVDLTPLSQTYNGLPRPVTATTTPASLAVEVTYNDSATVPSAAGSYAVIATVTDANYTGSATATLVIDKAPLELVGLTQVYDGMPKPVTTAATVPEGLPVSITYNGLASPPVDAGSYAILATIDDPNYQPTTSATLTIEKAAATILLADLTHTYTGSPQTITATTIPDGLAVIVTYDGGSSPPSLAGSYPVTATINDPNYIGVATATMVIAPATNDFAAWTTAYFTVDDQIEGLAADAADPDADELVNLVEYALGSDPRHPTPPLTPTHDSNGLSIVFTRPANLPGISYAAEFSDNLGTWSPVALEVLVPGAIETVRARVPLNTGNPSQRFLHLRIVRH